MMRNINQKLVIPLVTYINNLNILKEIPKRIEKMLKIIINTSKRGSN